MHHFTAPSAHRRAPCFFRLALMALLALFALPIAPLSAAEANPNSSTGNGEHTLVIGTRHAPPFSYQDEQGRWLGLSITLLEHLSQELGFRYELQRFDQMADLLDAVEEGRLDLAVAAITITPEREQRMDFSHPFHLTGLGIATTRGDVQSSWWIVIASLVSPDFLKVVGSLAIVLTIIGMLLWLAERRRNPQFDETPLRGIGAGFWWSAVTMTTVGYGDKAPITLPGRLIGLVWMFAGLIMIASITAQITSSLTLSAFQHGISGPNDLTQARSGVVTNTTAAQWAASDGLRHRNYRNLREALDGLAAGEVDAVIHDHPLLTYEVSQRDQNDLTVIEQTFERQDYGIAMPLNSPLRKDINFSVIEYVTSQIWVQQLGRYNLN